MDPLTRAVRTYLDHLSVERGLAANTLASYRRDLRRYVAHLDAVGEVASLIQAAVQKVEADGTYSSSEFGR